MEGRNDNFCSNTLDCTQESYDPAGNPIDNTLVTAPCRSNCTINASCSFSACLLSCKLNLR